MPEDVLLYLEDIQEAAMQGAERLRSLQATQCAAMPSSSGLSPSGKP